MLPNIYIVKYSPEQKFAGCESGGRTPSPRHLTALRLGPSRRTAHARTIKAASRFRLGTGHGAVRWRGDAVWPPLAHPANILLGH